MKIGFLVADTAESKAALAIALAFKDKVDEHSHLDLVFCLLSNGALNIFNDAVITKLNEIGRISCLNVSDVHQQPGYFGADNRDQALNDLQLASWLKALADVDAVFSGTVTRAQEQLCCHLQKSKNVKVIAYSDNLNFQSRCLDFLEATDALWLPNDLALADLKSALPQTKKALARKIMVTGHPDTDGFTHNVAIGKASKDLWLEALKVPSGKTVIAYLGAYGENYGRKFSAFIHWLKALSDNYHVILSAHPSALKDGVEADIIDEHQLSEKFSIVSMMMKKQGLSSDKVCGLADLVVSPGGSTMEIQLALSQATLPLWIVNESAENSEDISWHRYDAPQSKIEASPLAIQEKIAINSYPVQKTQTSSLQLLPHSANIMAQWLLFYAKQHTKPCKIELIDKNAPVETRRTKDEMQFELAEHFHRHLLWQNKKASPSVKEIKESGLSPTI